MSSFIEGQWLLVSTESGTSPSPFTDEISGDPVDPTVVTLITEVNGQPNATYTYGSDPTIVRDDVGMYHAVLDTTGKPGAWQITWSSDPDGTHPQVCVAIQTTTVNVYAA